MSASPKVVGLRGNPVADGRTPNVHVINRLRELLEKAETGEIVGVGIVSQYYDDSGAMSWEGVLGYKTVGLLHALQNNILKGLDT